MTQPRLPSRSIPGLNYAKYIREEINLDIKRNNLKEIIYSSELDLIYTRCKGHCVFCGKPLNPSIKTASNAPHAIFYTPLKVGGKAELDNIIIVCTTCMKDKAPIKKLHINILGVNSFGDLVESLINAIKRNAPNEEVHSLKRMLNAHLEEVAILMRYEAKYSDWEPNEILIREDGENSIPDIIEGMVKDPSKKEEFKDAIKQIVKTKKYRVVRNTE